MMKDVFDLIECLQKTPVILQYLLEDIPEEIFKDQRRPGKWSIHEHACHLAQSDQMILSRFYTFVQEEFPDFASYLPGKTVVDNLLSLDLAHEMEAFKQSREEMISLMRSFDDELWNKKANHAEYKVYSPYILLRHTLMHDHFHMYRIEELWLTKDAYLS